MGQKLKINTVGRDDSHEDEYHYPYEPTPYSVLLRLSESDYVSRDSVVVDYGCGKGRVGFFLNHKLGCRTIGVEYDEKNFENALQNLNSYYANQRKIQLFFYYPNEEYMSFLMTIPNLMFVDEIDCRELFHGASDRERIMIFEVI